MADPLAAPHRTLAYTLCFLRSEENVLMLKRKYPPHAGLLNGVGGKLLPGESPLACVMREVAEETGVRLTDARFGGVVTWTGFTAPARSGMYAYLADLPPGINPADVAGDMAEGHLSWQPLAAVVAGLNGVVENIPCFLAPMLAGAAPAEYALQYDGARLLGHTVRPLPRDLRY